MIVPEFWAESRLQHREGRKQVTVRRFGWSGESAVAAQAMADTRAREAMDRILAGEPLDRRERAAGYNGGQGLPIREEVLARHGEAVVTRNSYGAHCLNTPDLLIADIDFGTRASGRLLLVTFLGLFAIGMAAAFTIGSTMAFVLGMLAVLVLTYPLATALAGIPRVLAGGHEGLARRRVRRAIEKRTGWAARLYRTPAGMRVIVTHAAFDPRSEETTSLFRELEVDPVYAVMCRNQNCFRARLTAKPWRIGISRHLKPRSGSWPVPPEKLPARRAWIEQYETKAAGYAACRFVGTVGKSHVAREVEGTLQLHDRLSGTGSDKPIA